MEKINFQDGTRVSRAKVTIDGTDYIVTPAQFSGATPLSAYVMNRLQTNIENAINQNKDNIGGEEYDNTETYALGDIVLYEDQLYVCTTAVTVAEDFDSTKWGEINILEVIDNIQPLPVGGTTGQVLTKRSSTDGDAQWSDQTGGNIVYVGNEEDVPEDTKLWIDTDELLPESSEVVNSLEGDETTKAPSVKAVNDRFTYSTEEQRIGTWIDGKPLYRKVVNFGALPNASEKSVAHNISDLDIVTNYSAIAKNPQYGSQFPIPLTSAAGITSNIYIFFTLTNIVIGTGNDRTYFTQTYVTLEYTKTTD